jgi:hypothetical protein
VRFVWLTAVALAILQGPIGGQVRVASGGDLQAALNNARPGDTIVLDPGVTYVGNFVLPPKPGGSRAFITIRSAAADADLPGPDERMSPAFSPHLAIIRSPNGSPALATAPGAHHYRLLFLEFAANAQGLGDIIALGDGSPAQNSLAMVPRDLVIDRVYIHGDPVHGQKRGVALNSAATSVLNSYIADIKAVGQDSQAVGGWNGPGPFTITNNYLEAAGENVMFGGTDPAIPDLVPSDITLTGNVLTKPLAWRTEKWQVKNLLELKSGRRVRIERNVLEHNWRAAQNGFAVLFTVRNPGGCPWCQIESVEFERNAVRHVAAGISILGRDNNRPSRQTRAVTIRHNTFSDIDPKKWGGNGYFLMLQGEPREITVDHNTILQDHASGIVQVDGPPILQFVFTNNLVRHSAYGMIGTGHAPGGPTIAAFFPGARIAGNAIAEGNPRQYPDGNSFPSFADFQKQFVAYGGGDFRLTPSSVWRGAGTDGLDIGAVVPPKAIPRPSASPIQ